MPSHASTTRGFIQRGAGTRLVYTLLNLCLNLDAATSVMNGTVRSSRFLAVVLLLCTLPSPASAQKFVCWPIAPGDTASSLARRLTGTAAAAYGLAFQIRDPARRMFVPKSQYQRLQADWQACVAPGPVPKSPVAYAPVVELAASAIVPAQSTAIASATLTLAGAARPQAGIPFASPVVAIFSIILIALSAVAGSLTLRPIPSPVRRAGEDFVTVFARPLIDPSSSVPPIQARLRFARRRQQLDIFIAPGPGHRYPNLADHKKNVEYDVDRVIRVLGNCELCKPPRAAGKWVVVSIKV